MSCAVDQSNSFCASQHSLHSRVGSNCGLGGPKFIGRMTQNNINPVNNNAINKDKYTKILVVASFKTKLYS